MEAVLLIGVQGSGKSTFYRDHFFHTHARLSLDLLRTRHRLNAFLQTCLHTRQRFVIDNTNIYRQERAGYIQAARAAGFSVSGYYVQVPVSDALKRNAQRSGKQRIPDRGVLGTFKKLEPPSPDEGFDRLLIVELNADLQWQLRPWEAS